MPVPFETRASHAPQGERLPRPEERYVVPRLEGHWHYIYIHNKNESNNEKRNQNKICNRI